MSTPISSDAAPLDPTHREVAAPPVMPLTDLPRELRQVATTGELLGLVAPLSARAGLTRLRAEHEILPPGRRSSSPHAHTTREELVYVLAGTPELWWDGCLYPMRPGDVAGFRAGTGVAHAIVNNSDNDVELLLVATEPGDDTCLYPVGPEPGPPLEDLAPVRSGLRRPLSEAPGGAPLIRLEDVVRHHMLETFRASHENLTRTALALGMSRVAVRRHLRKYGAKPAAGAERAHVAAR